MQWVEAANTVRVSSHKTSRPFPPFLLQYVGHLWSYEIWFLSLLWVVGLYGHHYSWHNPVRVRTCTSLPVGNLQLSICTLNRQHNTCAAQEKPQQSQENQSNALSQAAVCSSRRVQTCQEKHGVMLMRQDFTSSPFSKNRHLQFRFPFEDNCVPFEDMHDPLQDMHDPYQDTHTPFQGETHVFQVETFCDPDQDILWSMSRHAMFHFKTILFHF